MKWDLARDFEDGLRMRRHAKGKKARNEREKEKWLMQVNTPFWQVRGGSRPLPVPGPVRGEASISISIPREGVWLAG